MRDGRRGAHMAPGASAHSYRSALPPRTHAPPAALTAGNVVNATRRAPCGIRWWRARTAVVACAAVATLLFFSTTTHGVGRASPRAASQAADGGANVYIDPEASNDLWVGTMDPGAASDGSSMAVISYIYNGLVRLVYNHKTKPVDIAPSLAAALPTISHGGLVYTFKLRPDARFSDGKQVTAQDVVYRGNSPVSA